MTLFTGAVLAGGGSRRMGSDKAMIRIDGRTMVERVAAALGAAGAVRTVVVGGAGGAITGLGLEHVPDGWPGVGPLGGVVTALHALESMDAERVAVLGCDLLAPDPHAISLVAGALPDHGPVVAVPEVGGRRQWLHAAWRLDCRAGLAAALAAGQRAVHRAVDVSRLEVIVVEGIPAAAVADADTIGDLPPGARAR